MLRTASVTSATSARFKTPASRSEAAYEGAEDKYQPVTGLTASLGLIPRALFQGMGSR